MSAIAQRRVHKPAWRSRNRQTRMHLRNNIETDEIIFLTTSKPGNNGCRTNIHATISIENYTWSHANTRKTRTENLACNLRQDQIGCSTKRNGANEDKTTKHRAQLSNAQTLPNFDKETPTHTLKPTANLFHACLICHNMRSRTGPEAPLVQQNDHRQSINQPLKTFTERPKNKSGTSFPSSS